ncbi:MAG: glycosyltransferase family 39 protein [Cryomorphaceae bacterium]|nr:glycosyltransferase family 39 protein [Cryomorphaceae bacterium]
MNKFVIPSISRIPPQSILIFFTTLMFAHHFFAYAGHFGFDDMHYARISERLLSGKIDFNDHFSYRLSVILLTSFSYFCFGISDFASSIPAILISILILLIVYRALLPFGKSALTFGLAMTTLSSSFLYFTDKLMPDIYVALSIMAAIFVIYQLRFSNRKKSHIFLAALFAFALLFGFMSKETIVLSAPLFGFFFILDLIRRQFLSFWVWAFFFGALLLGGYFAAIGMITGNPLHRFTAIEGNSYLNACSYDQQPTIVLIRRIAIDFFSMIIHYGMAVSFVFLIGHAVITRAKGLFSIENRMSFFISSTWILTLTANFMSISLTSYVPMCIDPRHYLYLIPVSAIAAGMVMKKGIFAKKKNAFVFALLALLCGIAYFLQTRGWNFIYFPLALLLSFGWWFNSSVQKKRFFLLIFIFILGASHYKDVRYAHDIKFRKQGIWLKDEVLSINKGIVVTDRAQAHFAEYYGGFNTDDSLKFIRFEFFSDDNIDMETDVYVLINPHTQYLSKLHPMDVPFYVRFMSDENKLIAYDERLGMKLYRMRDFSGPDERGKSLFHSTNSLTVANDFWNNPPGQNIESIDGYDCLKTGMYSSSFNFPLDSILPLGSDALYITTEMQCYFSVDVDAKLVILVEDSTGIYLWNDLPVNQNIESIGHWWPTHMNTIISGETIRPNSTLKVFLYNFSRGDVYFKDFSVEIFHLPN